MLSRCTSFETTVPYLYYRMKGLQKNKYKRELRIRESSAEVRTVYLHQTNQTLYCQCKFPTTISAYEYHTAQSSNTGVICDYVLLLIGTEYLRSVNLTLNSSVVLLRRSKPILRLTEKRSSCKRSHATRLVQRNLLMPVVCKLYVSFCENTLHHRQLLTCVLSRMLKINYWD